MRFDPPLVIGAIVLLATYGSAVVAYRRRRGRPWPVIRIASYAAGVASIVFAIESPLDAAGDVRFAPHMVQHLILTDLAAPLILLGGPLLLALGALPHVAARRIARVLRGPIARVFGSPVASWTIFITTLWAIHFGGFFEAALEHEPLHVLEHALYVSSALLFWLPIVAVGPTPWTFGPLSYPARMLYLLLAMPAEGFLGFAIYGSKRVLYPHYAAAGIADQQRAGELMWIGSGLVMFAAFMMVAAEWARHEERRAARADASAIR